MAHKRNRVTADFDQLDYDRLVFLEHRHGLSRAEIVRRGMRLALWWYQMTFWGRVRRCFFRF